MSLLRTFSACNAPVSASTTTRNGSAQMRLYVALSTFIILASLPLYLFDFKPKNLVHINFAGSEHGIPANSLSVNYNPQNHKIEFRFQNTYTLWRIKKTNQAYTDKNTTQTEAPKTHHFNASVSCQDSDGKQYQVQHCTVAIIGDAAKIMSISGTLALPAFNQPQKNATAATTAETKIVIEIETETENKIKTAQAPTKATSASAKKSSAEKNTIATQLQPSVNIQIIISYKQRELATITGEMSKDARYVQHLTISHPTVKNNK